MGTNDPLPTFHRVQSESICSLFLTRGLLPDHSTMIPEGRESNAEGSGVVDYSDFFLIPPSPKSLKRLAEIKLVPLMYKEMSGNDGEKS